MDSLEADEGMALEVRRIAAELDTFVYVARSWTYTTKLDGNGAGGHADIVAGCGGAKVFHDIIEMGGFGSRSDVRHTADRLILGRPLTRRQQATAEAIREVARRRIERPCTVSKPELPPDAGVYYAPSTFEVTPRVKVVSVVTDVDILRAKVLRYLRAHRVKPFGPRGWKWIETHAALAGVPLE